MWHEARRSEKKVHDLMDAARKRAERRAAFLAKKRGDPQQQLRIVGTRCRMHYDQAMYQATQDQHGLIPWNGKEDNLIDRFDGRALLDYIREADKTRKREKTEEEEELEEIVNFERYRDLIKRRRRGFSDEQGLLDVDQEDDAKNAAASERRRAGKGTYAQVGFSYEGGSQHMNSEDEGDDHDEDDMESSSDDSEDEEMECIGRDHGIQRFGYLAHMDKKAKAAERRQKESAKSGDPSLKKLSRKERRRVSQQERERERDAVRGYGHRSSDPYRGSPVYDSYRRRSRRSRSRSRSPSRRYERDRTTDRRVGKVEYITEFGGDNDEEPGRTYSPPPSPPPASIQAEKITRSSGRILEAIHGDPATTSVFPEPEKSVKKDTSSSGSSAMVKLSKPASGLKTPQGEKKETPQERLKRIMNKQLNKQIKKDTVSELLKKREQEKERQERLAETRRAAYRSRSRSSSYSRSRSRSRSRSPPRRYRRWSRSGSPTSRSRSPRRSRYT